MIRFQRSLQHRIGTRAEAIQWAKEAVEYLNTRYPEAKLQVFGARFGARNTLYWIGDFEDLASLDRFQTPLRSDEAYQDLLRKGADLFIEGGSFDTVLESM